MNYSSESKVIGTVKDLNLLYEIDHYHNKSVRDLFIKTLKSPIHFITEKTKHYHVLKNISFNIYEGDRIGLIGINGAGKTSLCRCLAGLIKPQSGEIKINGTVKALFDTNVGIIPELTGRENAQLMSEFIYPELSCEERELIIQKSLAFSELGEFIDIPYLKYSKGMQTRLGLSLISALKADLLIMDEVFDGADVFFQKKIAEKTLEMINRSGSVIFVSHSPDQIATICNRIIIIKDSSIYFDGDVREGLEIYLNNNVTA